MKETNDGKMSELVVFSMCKETNDGKSGGIMEEIIVVFSMSKEKITV